MRALRAVLVAGALAAAAGLTLACGAGSGSEPPVALMVVPHPDDELAATAIIEPLRNAGYEVMMLLVTDGEATVRCQDERGTEACATRRVAAWEQVADALGVEATQRWRAGIADGAASPEAVTNALCATATELAGAGRPVEVLVAASYFGGDGDIAVNYEHPDHRATNEAVLNQDCLSAPRLVRVPANDAPDLVLEVDRALQERLLGDAGVAQQAYGWLAFDFVSGARLEAWVDADTDRTSPFGRQQGFACVDAAGQQRNGAACPLG